MHVPRYDELPRLPKLGYAHAWDVYPGDDNLGTINFLTADKVQAAAQLVRTGEVINVGLPIDQPSPPLFGREQVAHTLFQVDRNNRDDRLDAVFPQASTQWDSLRHVRAREFGFFTGITEEFEPGPGRLGVEHWAEHGIIGRGVLLDPLSYLTSIGQAYNPFSRRAITSDELQATADAQAVTLRPGDILCVRLGWQSAYRALTPEQRVDYAVGPIELAGLHAGDSMARFLWDNQIVAVAADSPAMEMYPADPEAGSLHRRLLPLLGYAIGELFDFDKLVLACRADSRWEFMFVSVPLNVPGGVGSPANAVAIR